MKNRLNNYKTKYGCCAGDIVILAIISFLIIIIIYTLVAYSVGAFAEEIEKDKDKDKDKDICDTAIGWESNYQYCDKLYDESYPKNYYDDNNDGYPYQFVKCPDSDNITYPEGTDCSKFGNDTGELVEKK